MEEPDVGEVAVRRADREDLERQLEERRKAARRHTLWAILGLSPGAVIPLMLWATEVGVVVLGAGAVAVTAIEAWRASRARADADELEATLGELRAERGSNP